jgi:hypothetical protein
MGIVLGVIEVTLWGIIFCTQFCVQTFVILPRSDGNTVSDLETFIEFQIPTYVFLKGVKSSTSPSSFSHSGSPVSSSSSSSASCEAVGVFISS